MKKKNLLTMTLLAAFLFGFAAEMLAQTFTNTGSGNYNAACGAIIRMKTNDNGAVPRATISGNDIGTATKPIQGIVEWAAASGTQTVQAYYYERMVMAGAAAKTVLAGIHITGGACADFLTGYDSLATYPYYVFNTGGVPTGTITYNGAFIYDGTDEQNIYPQVNYDTLSIGGAGNAVVLANQTVTTQSLQTDPGAPLVVSGTLNLTDLASDVNGSLSINDGGSLTTGEGDVTIDGALTSAGDITTANGDLTATNTVGLTGTGTLTTSGTGLVNFQDVVTTEDGTTITQGSTGAMTFGDSLYLNGDLVNNGGSGPGAPGAVNFDAATVIGTTGTLTFGENANLYIGYTISNAGDGSNLAFNCGSNVYYDSTGLQAVLPTGLGNYGNLFLENGQKVGGTGGSTGSFYYDVSICGNFSLADGNLDMYKSGTNSGSLIMTDATKSATYAANEEVIGRMRRNWATGTSAYTFNNVKSVVTYNTAPTSGDYLAMDVRPGVAPRNYTDETDVDRKILVDYDLAGWNATIQVGYLDAEKPTFLGEGAGLSLDNLKFFESDNSGIEKLAGSGYVRNHVTDLHDISLANIEPGTGAVDSVVENKFVSGNDLVLRASNRMYSIADGRWTNPNSWDEGRVPNQEDDVELRNSIYVGIDGPFIGTLDSMNTKSEYFHYGNTNDPAAKSIVVAQKRSTGTANPALIIGNEDNPDSYIFRTVADGTITNNNTTANIVDFPLTAPKSGLGALVSGEIQGIWLVPYISGDKIPGLGTNTITNAGNVNNEGVIEVGQ